jgi:hypothetical protein
MLELISYVFTATKQDFWIGGPNSEKCRGTTRADIWSGATRTEKWQVRFSQIWVG